MAQSVAARREPRAISNSLARSFDIPKRPRMRHRYQTIRPDDEVRNAQGAYSKARQPWLPNVIWHHSSEWRFSSTIGQRRGLCAEEPAPSQVEISHTGNSDALRPHTMHRNQINPGYTPCALRPLYLQ